MSIPAHPWESDRWQVYSNSYHTDGRRVAHPPRLPWQARFGYMRHPKKFATFAEAIEYADRKARQ